MEMTVMIWCLRGSRKIDKKEIERSALFLFILIVRFRQFVYELFYNELFDIHVEAQAAYEREELQVIPLFAFLRF